MMSDQFKTAYHYVNTTEHMQATSQQNYYDMLAQLDFLQGELTASEDSKDWQDCAYFYRATE